MGDSSKIQWTDATWNPVTGCTRVSPGCENCYAEQQARRLQAQARVLCRQNRELLEFLYTKLEGSFETSCCLTPAEVEAAIFTVQTMLLDLKIEDAREMRN